jgi:hypothetical protein
MRWEGVVDNLSWGELFDLRNAPENQSRERQAVLGPAEHRAYAREAVREKPSNALGLAVATPAYTLAKLFGAVGARSPASLGEVLAGYQGIGQGLKDWWNQ